MKLDKYDQSVFLVLKAAYQYYILDRSQNQIAKDLDVSVTTVSRLLKRARDEKIIEFVIRNPYVECLNPVSYTHLDVYKRQLYVYGNDGGLYCKRSSCGYGLLF